MDTMPSEVIEVRRDGRKRVRKSYSEAYKRRVVGLTWAPGMSVAQIAQRHGLNANLLFTWRRQVGKPQDSESSLAGTMPTLLPVAVTPIATEAPAPRPVVANDGCIEIDIGAARMRLQGRVDLETVAAVLRMLEARR
jgi:transposase